MNDETRSDNSKNDYPSSTNTPEKPSINISRRRLAQGAFVAPVLMTLPSRSVLAGSCNTLSGMLSGNLSGTDGESSSCEDFTGAVGASSGAWKKVCDIEVEDPLDMPNAGEANIEKWPANVPPSIMLVDLLGRASDVSVLANKSCLEILWLDNGGFYQAAITAYLNAITVTGYFFSPEQVIDIYQDILSNGLFPAFPDSTDSPVFTEAEVIALFKRSWDNFVGGHNVDLAGLTETPTPADRAKIDAIIASRAD